MSMKYQEENIKLTSITITKFQILGIILAIISNSNMSYISDGTNRIVGDLDRYTV